MSLSKLISAAHKVAVDIGSSMKPRNKRLLFIGSLVATLTGKETLDKGTVQKLHEVMALSHDPKAVQGAALLSKAIWKGKITRDILGTPESQATEERTRLVAQRVLSVVPAWLRYADDATIEKDIGKLLQSNAVVS